MISISIRFCSIFRFRRRRFESITALKFSCNFFLDHCVYLYTYTGTNGIIMVLWAARLTCRPEILHACRDQQHTKSGAAIFKNFFPPKNLFAYLNKFFGITFNMIISLKKSCEPHMTNNWLKIWHKQWRPQRAKILAFLLPKFSSFSTFNKIGYLNNNDVLIVDIFTVWINLTVKNMFIVKLWLKSYC